MPISDVDLEVIAINLSPEFAAEVRELREERDRLRAALAGQEVAMSIPIGRLRTDLDFLHDRFGDGDPILDALSDLGSAVAELGGLRAEVTRLRRVEEQAEAARPRWLYFR